MVQRRAYPRTPLERRGQVNWRAPKGLPPELERFKASSITPRDLNDRDPTPRRKREGIDPNCVIVGTRKKGFGSLGLKESTPLSPKSTDLILDQFDPERFQRYRVNIYLKK